MTFSLVKTGAIAAALVLAPAGTSFAAQYAIVDQDSAVREYHSNNSDIVNYVDEGDIVQIIGHSGNWYKIAIPGDNGWIRSYKLDFDYEDEDAGPGVKLCFMGPIGQVCVKG
ncbi:MAG: SH3 domain-containing protein [Devosia sp.]